MKVLPGSVSKSLTSMHVGCPIERYALTSIPQGDKDPDAQSFLLAFYYL